MRRAIVHRSGIGENIYHPLTVEHRLYKEERTGEMGGMGRGEGGWAMEEG